MLTLDVSPRWSRWGAVLLAVVVAGCGGKAGRDHAESQGNEAGKAGTMIGGTGSGDDVGGSSASSGVVAAAGGNVIGGSSAATGGSGSGGGLPEGLTECPARESLGIYVQVNDLHGRAEQGTNGKVRVEVTKVEELASSEMGAPEDLAARRYVLRGPTQDWELVAAIPGLTSELISEGSVLDFQLETSPGYIPLGHTTNQVFGLFTVQGGDLLVFGADITNKDPLPDLSFLGLDVKSGGSACGYGGSHCRYAVHTAHFSASGAKLDLQPGKVGKLGDFLVSVETFQSLLPLNNCDASGRSVIVGAESS